MPDYGRVYMPKPKENDEWVLEWNGFVYKVYENGAMGESTTLRRGRDENKLCYFVRRPFDDQHVVITQINID